MPNVSADVLIVNIATIGAVAVVVWWLTRWERKDRTDHRAVARSVDHRLDSLELSKTLMEVRRRLADEHVDRSVAEYMDGVRDRAAPDERPPLRSV